MTEYMQIFLGTSFSSNSPKEIQILKDHLYCINTDGMIEKIVSPEEPDYQTLLATYQGQDNFHRLAEGQYFCLALSTCMFTPRSGLNLELH